jgi:hypothetical protein
MLENAALRIEASGLIPSLAVHETIPASAVRFIYLAYARISIRNLMIISRTREGRLFSFASRARAHTKCSAERKIYDRRRARRDSLFCRSPREWRDRNQLLINRPRSPGLPPRS